MKEFTASSGARVKIGVAGWDDTITLKNAALREMADAGLSIKGLKLSKDMDISTLVSAFLKVESSPAVYAALWPCLERSLYNGQKINKGIFENPEARQDYYEILKEFLVVNITPFLPKVASEWLEKAKTTFAATQEST